MNINHENIKDNIDDIINEIGEKDESKRNDIKDFGNQIEL